MSKSAKIENVYSINAASFAQGVDLAYIQTGISGVFLGALNFENLYSFWVLVKAAVFFCFVKINAVFLSVLCLQQYF